MDLLFVFFIGVGLSMDAFAVAVCKGLAVREFKWKYALITGLYFGVFQGLMPLLGFYLGGHFKRLIAPVDHWVAFILLSIIGLNMIREARKNEACPVYPEQDKSFSFKAMLPLAVATSIDALAVGLTLAFLQADIYYAVILIGLTTFTISLAGVKIGHIFGMKFKAKAEVLGGVILIVIGTKTLLEHLGIL